MTPKEKLVTVEVDSPREEALNKLHKNRIEKVLVVNDDFQLKGMITVKDVRSARHYPIAWGPRLALVPTQMTAPMRW